MKKESAQSTFAALLPYMAVFLFLGSLPELLAWLARPANTQFAGALVNLDDLNVYLSAIRQGAEGRWLFRPQVSPEVIPSHLAFYPYLLLGNLLHPASDQLLLTFFGFRLAALGSVFIALTKLVKTIYPDSPQYQLRMMRLLLFASGSGWLFIGLIDGNYALTPDLITPEWNLITAYLSAPHFLLGLTFEILCIRSIILLKNDWNLTNTFSMFFWGALLGLTYPYIIPILGLIVFTSLLANLRKDGNFQTRYVVQICLGAIPMVFFLLYYGYLLPQDEQIRLALIENNRITPPSPVGLLLSWGLFVLLAGLGLKKWFRSAFSLVIPVWAISSAAALYLPLSFSGRFLLGLFIPLTILADYGFESVLVPKFKSQEPNKITWYFFLLSIPSTVIFLIFSFQSSQTTRDFPYYYKHSELQALEWLAGNTTGDDLILADYPAGSLAPRYIRGKTFIGHYNLTIDFAGKRQAVLEFWDTDSSPADREELLSQWGITYIYQGTYEKVLASEKVSPPGELVYQNEDVSIYEITP